MRKTLALICVLFCAVLFAQPGYADSPQRIPDVSLDRADRNAVWRMSDHVQTANSPAPAKPGAVYLQFGFMGCEPCERLAVVANEAFGDTLPTVTRVYVHLDDVLMTEGSRPRTIWKQLFAFSKLAPYTDFITLRRGNIPLMQSLCGDSAAVPSALLIRPDGTYTVLMAPEEAKAREHFQSFLDSLATDAAPPADPEETR